MFVFSQQKVAIQKISGKLIPYTAFTDCLTGNINNYSREYKYLVISVICLILIRETNNDWVVAGVCRVEQAVIGWEERRVELGGLC